MDISTRAQLLAQGHTDATLRAAVSRGILRRVIRGRYASGQPRDHWDYQRALILGRDEVLCLESAALAHGLPLLRPSEQMHVIRPGTGRSRARSGWTIHTAELPDQDVVEVDGIRATSVARTIVDLARLRGVEAGLVPWESARWAARQSSILDALDSAADQIIARQRCRRGIASARQCRALASAYSQSPMETASLWHMRLLGLAEPQQQFTVYDQSGRLVGTTDFAWPDRGVLGEYDGEDKYDRLRRPGESPAEVVRREKRRQEAMEALGWVFARWGKRELSPPTGMRQRILTAWGIAAARGAGTPAAPVPRWG